ncbi:hypothetical protein AB0M02_27830 [Actinoplanes sp. NPDC051861]|uniref:hypothetical protein n=1 Tax=Actinoplanes sp. NPDC051861 TaxID=3155170 RepID=UPI0034488720
MRTRADVVVLVLSGALSALVGNLLTDTLSVTPGWRVWLTLAFCALVALTVTLELRRENATAGRHRSPDAETTMDLVAPAPDRAPSRRSRVAVAVGATVVVAAAALFTAGPQWWASQGQPHAAPSTRTSAAPPGSVPPSSLQPSTVPPSTVPPTLRTAPGRAQPEAVAYAFAAAWVNHRDITAKQWLSRLSPNATAALTEQLTGVDPATVPAERVTGRPSLYPVTETQTDVGIAMDSGMLTLRLVAPDGGWVVDGLDWDAT